jgi:hypothetical protein
VKKLPRFSDGDVLDDVSKLLEEQDANALGLNVIWIDDFAEVPKILDEITVENHAYHHHSPDPHQTKPLSARALAGG